VLRGEEKGHKRSRGWKQGLDGAGAKQKEKLNPTWIKERPNSSPLGVDRKSEKPDREKTTSRTAMVDLLKRRRVVP